MTVSSVSRKEQRSRRHISRNIRSFQHPPTHFICAICFYASMPFDLDSTPFTVCADGVCRYVDTKEPIECFDVTSTRPEATSPSYSGMFDENTRFLRRYSSSREGRSPIKIPTTHIVGAIDGYHQQGLLLKDLCVPQTRQFVEHRAGHDIPRDRNTTMKIAMTIENMLHSVLVG